MTGTHGPSGDPTAQTSPHDDRTQLLSRRRLLHLAGATWAAVLAGCTTDQEPPPDDDAPGGQTDPPPDDGPSTDGLIFRGLPHTPLGDATLELDAQGHLHVTDVGTSGDDGVEIGIGMPESALVRFQDLLRPEETTEGPVLGVVPVSVGDSELGRIQGVDTGADEFEVRVDYTPIGSETYTLRVLVGGDDVFEQTGRGKAHGVGGLPESVQVDVEDGGRLCVMFMWEELQEIRAEGQRVEGDAVMMLSEGGQQFAPGDIEAVRYLMGGGAARRIVDAAIEVFGLDVRAGGKATLQARPDRLTIGNLAGTEGGYMSVSLPGSMVHTLDFAPDGLLPLPQLEEGATFDYSVRRRDGSLLARLPGENVGEVMEHTVDFSPIGASTYELQLLQGGQTLAELDDQDGVIRAAPPGGVPDRFVAVVLASGELCLMGMWDEPRPITVEGEGTFEADSLMLRPNGDESLAPDSLGEVRLGGTRIPEIEIVGMEAKS